MKLHWPSVPHGKIILLGVLVVVFGGMVFGVVRHHGSLQPDFIVRSSEVHPAPTIRSALVVSGVQAPTGIIATATVGDKRLFVLEQAGDIRILEANGVLDPTPFLDIRSKVQFNGEMGLLGLAFSPQYQKNGYFYINYIDKEQNTIVARYSVTSHGGEADPTSEKVLFKLKQPYPNHNGGDLKFGPDGYLYIALGDGGSGGDPENRAQDKTSYFGKILRIDVNKGDPYAVPATNPFVKEAGAKPEIWAYGLRNPWRISFDKKTGDLYIADVGQGLYEEIDIQKAGSKGGENYGWRCYEGFHAFKLDSCKDATAYTAPALEYDHQEKRCSVTGGYVYRGSRYIGLMGKYFYADYCNGELHYAYQNKGKLVPTLALKTPYNITAFGQGSDGELYFADYKTGSIYHLEDAAE
jgi:glucose/arabinose dehydrogenase